MDNPFFKGQTVKFLKPLGANEATQEFIVIEPRGPRTLVTLKTDKPRPLAAQYAYLTIDLVDVDA